MGDHHIALGARAFYKKLGIVYDKSPSALDKSFLKEFSPSEQDQIRETWDQIHSGGSSASKLYKLPVTQKQAALLFSHDRLRMLISTDWIKQVIHSVSPNSIIEFGCGAGFLLQYLHHCFPKVEISGVDQCDNLIKSIPGDLPFKLICANYHEKQIDSTFDLAICDFGWDISDIPPSKKEHSLKEVFGHPTCPGCTTDFEPFYKSLLKSLESNLKPDGHIALVGRFINASHKIACFNAIQSLGISIRADHSKSLRIKHPDGQVESFHAYLISPKPMGRIIEDVEQLLSL